MRRDDEPTGLFRATLVGLVLFAVSTALLAIADEALDITAVVGGIGLVMSGALLGLTVLVARWRAESSGGYIATNMAVDDEGGVAAAAFDDPATELPLDDAAAI